MDLGIVVPRVLPEHLIPGDVFFADIIDGCKNLECIALINVVLDKELLQKVWSLPNIKKADFTDKL